MYDVCIVGAGIAGTSLAAVLGKKNFKVALIEQNWNEKEDIVGELLQPGGVRKLRELKLEEALRNIDAQPICGYAISLDDNWLALEYPKSSDEKSIIGYGFKYRRFIQNLRNLCQSNKNVDCIQGKVTRLIEKSDQISGVEVRSNGSLAASINSNLTVISQGGMKTLSRSLSQSNTSMSGYMLGLKIKNSELPFHGRGHVILADQSPILSYPISSDEIRVLIDFNIEETSLKGEALTKYLLERILPQMPEQLREGFEISVKEGKFKAKPTCQLSARPILKDGVMLLGDSLNMRHPITGGGMTVALTDVKALVDKLVELKRLDSQKLVRKSIRQFYLNRYKLNATLNILALALYQVFRHKILKIAFYEYLRKNESNAYEPMSILSGISRGKRVLLRNFLAVAGFSFFISKVSNHTTVNLWKSIRVYWDSLMILYPLILNEIPRVYQKKCYSNINAKIKSGHEIKQKTHKKPERTGSRYRAKWKFLVWSRIK